MNATDRDAAIWAGRYCRVVAASATGAVLGRVGAFLMWGYIYGIGSSVITDELYEELHDQVVRSGFYFGLLTGIARALLPHRRLFADVFSQHAVGLIVGGVCAHDGWRAGLAGDFGSQLLVLVALGVRSVMPRTDSAPTGTRPN